MSERPWLGLYVGLVTVVCVLLIELVQVSYKLSLVSYVSVSIIFFALAAFVIYLVKVVDLLEPTEIERKIEIEERRQVDELVLELRGENDVTL